MNSKPIAPSAPAASDTLVLPHMEEAMALFSRCVKSESIGLIYGGNGCGKTETLKYLARNAGRCDVPGDALYYRCCHADGQTRGIRDLLVYMGAGGAMLANGSSVSVQMAVKLACREMRQRNIRALLLDEADLWTLPTLSGLVTLLDVLIEQEWPVTPIFAGALNPDLWLGGIPAARSRILHVQMIPALDVDTSAAVLAGWDTRFAAIAQRFDDGEALAGKIFQLIHRGTSGNLRRLDYFRDIFPADEVITLRAVQNTLSLMVNSATE